MSAVLLLRPIYFLAAAFIGYLDALDSALGVILILIGGKLLLGQAVSACNLPRISLATLATTTQ